MTYVCTVALFLATLTSIAHATSFLSRAQGDRAATMDAELQSTIMRKIEVLFGDEAALMCDRLHRILDQLRIRFESMPKNEEGKLEHAAIRHALRGCSCSAVVGMSVGCPMSAMISKKQVRQMEIFKFS